MNRIDKLFQTKSKNILSIYFPAGFPELDSTVEILKGLQQAEIDLVEIGIPFSDPIADGPVIQQASKQALDNGMSVKILLNQLKSFRDEINIPAILMGYFNPVLQFGVEDFLVKCEATGIDGIILPDLPFEIFEKKYAEQFKKYDIHFIPLITPSTSDERIELIVNKATSFIYAVTSPAVTGNSLAQSEGLSLYLEKLRKINKPVLAGFGIRNAEQFENICEYVNGGIIGTAFIEHIHESENFYSGIKKFVKQIRKA
jgi:tryptophan synthase alpha chain